MHFQGLSSEGPQCGINHSMHYSTERGHTGGIPPFEALSGCNMSALQ